MTETLCVCAHPSSHHLGAFGRGMCLVCTVADRRCQRFCRDISALHRPATTVEQVIGLLHALGFTPEGITPRLKLTGKRFMRGGRPRYVCVDTALRVASRPSTANHLTAFT